MSLFSSGKVLIIAEMANSHKGDLARAKKITESAAAAGADAIKYQKFTADELAEPSHQNYQLYKKLEMSIADWKELVNFARTKGLKVLFDVFGVKSASEVSKLGIDGYKIHSSDVTNPHILKFLGLGRKTIFLSAAGCLPNEIDEAIKILSKKRNREIILMHGFQGYPTKVQDLNLHRIATLKKRYELKVGIMDHTSGDSKLARIVPLIGIGFGADVIEKHITLNRSQKGLDYYSALNPDEFTEMVYLIRQTERSLGSYNLELSSNELKYRIVHKKNPVAIKFIKKGSKLTEAMFEFKRTRTKVASIPFYEFAGRVTIKDIAKGEVITKSALSRKEKKVAAVIACRIDSSRLLAKPLQLVGGYKIIELLLKQLQNSSLISEIVLAISQNPGNEIFVDFARKHNIKYILGDDTDVLQRLIDGAKYVNADVVFRITSENPFIYWEGIDKLIKKHIDGNFDFSYSMNVPLGSGYEVINLVALEESHNRGSKRHRSELCSLYINENKAKFKIYRFESEKFLQRSDLRLTVDNPEDLQVARLIHNSLGKNDKPISLKRIIKFLDDNPNIAKINSNIPMKRSRIWL